MQIIPFPAHYQLVYANFDFSSFSRISCAAKGHLLTCKRASFTTQKGTFYKPLCNLLILWRLQTQFFTIILRFAVNTPLLFVRLFLIPRITLPSCLSHPFPALLLLSSAPFPSPLSCFRGHGKCRKKQLKTIK